MILNYFYSVSPFLKSVRQLMQGTYRQMTNNFVLQDDSNGKFVDQELQLSQSGSRIIRSSYAWCALTCELISATATCSSGPRIWLFTLDSARASQPNIFPQHSISDRRSPSVHEDARART